MHIYHVCSKFLKGTLVVQCVRLTTMVLLVFIGKRNESITLCIDLLKIVKQSLGIIISEEENI